MTAPASPAGGRAALRRVCVFCGSTPGSDPAFAAAARRLAAELAARRLGLVYGGGAVGLMGILADAVLARGGEAIGVIPHSLWQREVGHRGLTALHVVDSMHERKAKMAELADGFVALPGGIGTLEEIFEIWTWAQLGVHRKPCALLDAGGYWQPLLGFLDHAVASELVRPATRELLLVDDDPARLLDRFAAFEPADLPRWVDRRET